ncbi:hypothetical protein RND61_26670 [Streptomyces sp. TRM76323]|uniref:Uncharacterized protein n=1 Tax=Streptomyces tamarix TaxID=3078565 RepID=A0ABU3QS35_9ACTN|nr:hypothetical protein [Streptomyces tamarix]MDT9685621.1 hypothetical protein [Streptomyces tamarix]
MNDQSDGPTETAVRLCEFPAGCSRPAKAKAPGTPGPPSKYCDDPDHTALKALRWERKHGKDAAARQDVVPDDLSTLPHSAAVAEAQTTEISLRSLLVQVLEVLPGHLAAVEAAGDPELASVQVANAQNAARLAVTEAQAKLGVEHEARIAAEQEAKRLKSLKETAEEAAVEADGLREQAESTATLMFLLALHAVRSQQVAEREAEERVTAADARAKDAQEAARAEIERVTTETNKQIEAAKAAAEKRIEEHRTRVEKDAEDQITAARKEAEDKVAAARKEAEDKVAAARKDVENIERTARERVEKLQAETAQHKATAEAATAQVADAKRERKDLIQEHVTDRANLIKQHNDERDELVKRHNADRDRLLEELDQSREFGKAQAAAAERTEKARKALEGQVRRLERQVKSSPAASSGKGGKSSSPAADGLGREQVSSSVDEDEPIPGQSLIVDDQGKPVQSEGEGDSL